jgi:hypothetical protein
MSTRRSVPPASTLAFSPSRAAKVSSTLSGLIYEKGRIIFHPLKSNYPDILPATHAGQCQIKAKEFIYIKKTQQ